MLDGAAVTPKADVQKQLQSLLKNIPAETLKTGTPKLAFLKVKTFVVIESGKSNPSPAPYVKKQELPQPAHPNPTTENQRSHSHSNR